jgi:hypothetical protein
VVCYCGTVWGVGAGLPKLFIMDMGIIIAIMPTGIIIIIGMLGVITIVAKPSTHVE